MNEDQKPSKKPSEPPNKPGSVENLVKSSLREANDFITTDGESEAKLEPKLGTESRSASESTHSPSRMEEFAKTPIAARLSGTYHETTGKLKRKFGEFTNDSSLKEEGLNQEVLGKVHRLVGSIRTIRVATREKLELKKAEGKKLLRKHGMKLLDMANEIADDVKNLILK